MLKQSESYILNPIKFDDFITNYWDKHQLIHIQRELPGYFDHVINIDEIDRLVCGSRIPPTNINLAQNNDPLPLSSFCSGDLVDHKKVLALHRRGATIILRSIEQWSPAFLLIRAEFERLFGFEAQINVYLTPASEKSTPPHWDTHDLFVLQISGSKLWKIFEGNRTLPLENERFKINEDFVGKMKGEYLIKAGDTFFLPRGVIHEPIAATYSIHISIGIRSLRWLEVCQEALENLASENGSILRETVNYNQTLNKKMIENKVSEIIPNTNQLILSLNQTLTSQKHKYCQNFIGTLKSNIDICLPTEQSRFQLREGVNYSVTEVRDKLEIVFGSEKILLPQSMLPALKIALNNQPYNLTDLPIEDYEKKALCLALVQIGLIKECNKESC